MASSPPAPALTRSPMRLFAAESGLMAAAHHTGLVEAFWSLTQLTQAARPHSLPGCVRRVDAPDNPSLPAILSAV